MTELEEKEFNRKFDSWLDSEYDKYCEAEFDKYCQTLEQEKSKQLTQDIFKGAPDWVRSAAKTRFATVIGYSCESSELVPTPNRHTTTGNLDGFKFEIIDFCDETANWQNSAIDRE